MEVVYRGIDQLDISFQGALSFDVRERLRAARARAAAQGAPEFIEINGVKGHVAGHGIGRQGFSFIFDTGPDGETWKIKDNGEVDLHNIFVEPRSAQLAVRGYAGIKAALWERLEALEARVVTESINRVDYAVDIVAPDFEPDPKAISCHSRAKIRPFYGIPKAGDQDVPRPILRGRRYVGMMVGQQPNRQVEVYDKRLQVMDRVKETRHWLDIWGFDRDECPVVWRVEARAGKEHLTDWRIKTFDDLEQRMGDMFAKAMCSIRFLARCPKDGENITRVPNHPLWDLAADVMRGELVDYVSGAEQGRVVEGRREEIDKRYCGQIFGLLTGLSVARQIPLSQMTERLPSELADDVLAFLETRWRDFRRRHDRASKRLHFLEE